MVESGRFLSAHENPIFRGGPTSMICDITYSFEPVVVQYVLINVWRGSLKKIVTLLLVSVI